jgi:hypothetical protein
MMSLYRHSDGVLPCGQTAFQLVSLLKTSTADAMTFCTFLQIKRTELKLFFLEYILGDHHYKSTSN